MLFHVSGVLSGFAARLAKPLTMYDQNLQFPYPIYDLTKDLMPYLRPLWLAQLLQHNLWSAFVHVLITNDEKVASSKHIPNPRLDSKNHTLFKTKTAGKPIPFGAARTCSCTYYSPYIVVPLPGFQLSRACCCYCCRCRCCCCCCCCCSCCCCCC